MRVANRTELLDIPILDKAMGKFPEAEDAQQETQEGVDIMCSETDKIYNEAR